jgi:hypothetical protein
MTNDRHVREHDPFSGHADPAATTVDVGTPFADALTDFGGKLRELGVTPGTVAPQEWANTPVPELGPTPLPPADPLPPVPAVAAKEPEVKKPPVRRGRKPRRTVSKPAAK